jgi:hypothetical protein
MLLTKFHIIWPSGFTRMSLEAGNRRKSPVTLAVTAGYFFSLKKIMRENLSSNSTVRVSTAELVKIVGPDRQNNGRSD